MKKITYFLFIVFIANHFAFTQCIDNQKKVTRLNTSMYYLPLVGHHYIGLDIYNMGKNALDKSSKVTQYQNQNNLEKGLQKLDKIYQKLDRDITQIDKHASLGAKTRIGILGSINILSLTSIYNDFLPSVFVPLALFSDYFLFKEVQLVRQDMKLIKEAKKEIFPKSERISTARGTHICAEDSISPEDVE